MRNATRHYRKRLHDLVGSLLRLDMSELLLIIDWVNLRFPLLLLRTYEVRSK